MEQAILSQMSVKADCWILCTCDHGTEAVLTFEHFSAYMCILYTVIQQLFMILTWTLKENETIYTF